MPAEFDLHDATLEQTLERLQAVIRGEPGVPAHRAFLFQLLAVLGQWERALTQLAVLGETEPASIPMAHAYREAVQCEVLRAQVFAGTRAPVVFGEPEEWLALMLEALKLTAAGRFEQAQDLRAGAYEKAPTTSGTLVAEEDGAGAAGRPFEWIADADSRLGPVLEAVVNGRYYWVPFHRIRRLTLERPADLRDLVWLPAQFQWANGGESVGLIPTRYPGSETASDPRIRLARRTEWTEETSGVFCGVGQRMIVTDRGEYPIMEIRSIALDTQRPQDSKTVDSESANPPTG